MNERIRELGLQAADWLENQDSINPAHALQLYQRKFAELIVKECADLCMKYETCEDFGKPNEYRKGHHFSTMIKHHFGVKE